jgi:maltooligosyltrehalose trehalohydrolase
VFAAALSISVKLTGQGRAWKHSRLWNYFLSHAHHMSFGAQLTQDGVRFRLWAPEVDRVDIEIDGNLFPMHRLNDGWNELTVSNARAGTLYRFVLPDGLRVPDPVSRFQPSDVHGPSEVIDPTTYVWQNESWPGRPWEECVVYELHVGSFTREGTFRAALERLDHLVELGVTAIELMPIADFPGARNWGYDGVLPYAPDASYGRPDDLKAFIDAAHGKGLMVFLDVVYNHFGPDGNYLSAYAPIFKGTHTPWGAAINLDAEHSEQVRELIIENAVYWTQEYLSDGLRLDAVHALIDTNPQHILEVIASRVRKAATGRHIHLIIENEENQTSWLVRDADGRPQHYTAQWNDDVHHALHAAATGETSGYYADYADDTKKLGRALGEGFAFQGETMPYRGTPRGEPSAFLPPSAFIAFIQNHDQIGNRAFGERLTAIASPEAIRAIASIYLLLPQIPMIFMGEEWGASQPFPFFCDFAGELSDAVREGRRAEFAKFPEFQSPDKRALIPDPTAEDTFLSAKLNWDDIERGDHAEWKSFYKNLLDVRHKEIIPHLKGCKSICYEILGEQAVLAAWMLGDGATLTLCANLKAQPLPNFELPLGRRIWTQGTPTPAQLEAWNVVWLLRGENDSHAS